MGTVSTGILISTVPATAALDLIFRESIIKPKDPYHFKNYTENSTAGSFPLFNQPW